MNYELWTFNKNRYVCRYQKRQSGYWSCPWQIPYSLHSCLLLLIKDGSSERCSGLTHNLTWHRWLTCKSVLIWGQSLFKKYDRRCALNLITFPCQVNAKTPYPSLSVPATQIWQFPSQTVFEFNFPLRASLSEFFKELLKKSAISLRSQTTVFQWFCNRDRQDWDH